MNTACGSCGEKFLNIPQHYATSGNFCFNCMRRINGKKFIRTTYKKITAGDVLDAEFRAKPENE